MKQLEFNLKSNVDFYDLKNFIVHNGNKDIFNFITSSYILNENIFLLTGAKKSGKTYICKIWHKLENAIFLKDIDFSIIEEKKKYILEDIENIKIDEEKLFLLINTIIEKKSILLITSIKYINQFNFNIPDLNSRFKNIYNFILSNIDDEQIKYDIILKLMKDKQIYLDKNIVKYGSKKISSRYDVIIKFVNKISNFLSENKKKITISDINNIIKKI